MTWMSPHICDYTPFWCPEVISYCTPSAMIYIHVLMAVMCMTATSTSDYWKCACKNLLLRNARSHLHTDSDLYYFGISTGDQWLLFIQFHVYILFTCDWTRNCSNKFVVNNIYIALLQYWTLFLLLDITCMCCLHVYTLSCIDFACPLSAMYKFIAYTASVCCLPFYLSGCQCCIQM
jgi:hypothetical protein